MMKKNDLAKQNSRSITVWRVILTSLCTAITGWIFWNSSRTAVESTEQSTPLTDSINNFLRSLNIPLTVTENMIRKTAHFMEYAILGALLAVTVYLYVCRKPRKVRFVVLITPPIGAIVAVCDELIQTIPAGRSCEVRDMLIDFCGVLFSTLIVTLIISIIEKRRQKRMEQRKVRP